MNDINFTRGDNMIIEVDASTKEPRSYNNRTQYGVKPAGQTYWVNLEVDFRPTKGQRFDVKMSTVEKDGKIFRNATIIGPAPPAASVEEQFKAGDAVYARYTGQREAGAPDATKPLAFPPSASSGPSAPLPPLSGKIPWDDWIFTAGMAWNYAVNVCAMPPAEAVAFVNTTLISFSNGKIAMPLRPSFIEGEPPADPFDWADDKPPYGRLD